MWGSLSWLLVLVLSSFPASIKTKCCKLDFDLENVVVPTPLLSIYFILFAKFLNIAVTDGKLNILYSR